MRKLIVFDLDGTRAESKSPVDADMAELLSALLGIFKIKAADHIAQRSCLAEILPGDCAPSIGV